MWVFHDTCCLLKPSPKVSTEWTYNAVPDAVPASDDSDCSSTQSDGSAGFVGVDFTRRPMNQDASWNRKVIECGAFLERKLKQVERFGTIAFEHQSPSVVVERIKDDDPPKERAIAILECVYELRNDLRPKEMEYLQEIYKSLKRLLIDCGAKPDEVQEYMVGAIWQGSICMILEICSSVLEDLFAKVVDAKWDFPIGYNGVTITELSPAFKITMPFFVKVTVPEGRQVPDVWLFEEDRAKFLLPTCDAARSCIMQGGRQLSEFCIKDTVHDALKSLPTFRRTEGNTLVSWHSIQQESTSVGHFLRSLPTYSENSVGQSAKPSGGWTPLHNSSARGHLLDAVDVLSSSHTPLHDASQNGNESIASVLLDNGANVNVKDEDGWTPLHYACDNGHDAVVSLLLEKGADPTITNNKGKTPLQIAQEENKQNCVAAIEQFQRRQQQLKEQKRREERQRLPQEKESRLGRLLPWRRQQQQEEASAKKKRDKHLSQQQQQDAAFKKEREELRHEREKEELRRRRKEEEELAKMKLQEAEQKQREKEQAAALKKQEEEMRQQQEKQNCVAAIEQFQPRFYRHLDEISTLVQHATENEFVSLVPIFEKALNELSDFLQLKYYFTAVNAQYRLGTITTEDRNMMILAALEKAKVWCVSPFHVAMYRVALRYSLSENIITQFQLDQLDVASLECDIAHTDYIQAMQMIIRQNAMRINRLENSLAMFQQAVVTSVCELQQNVIAVNKNVQNMHRDMHGMAVAINDTQAALKKFKASLEFKRKVEAGCSLVTAVLNAVSLGSAGSALQGVLGLTLASTADFADLAHLSGVLNEVATTIGNVSIHNMLNTGIMLAEGYPPQRLEDALRNENAIVVIAASAAVFSKALDLDTTSDELVAKPLNEEPPLFDKLSMDPPIAGEPSKGYDLDNTPSAPALPASSSDDVEMKVAGLEKKRERLIRRAKLAKELDQEVGPIYQQIQLLDEEIEELHDRIDNIRI